MNGVAVEIRMCTGPNCTRELPPGSRADQQFCSQGCRLRAFRQRRRLDKLRSSHPETATALADEMSLTEKYDRAREAKAASDPGDDLREFSDYGELPGDQDYDDGGQADEQTARVRAMIRADAARRVPRRPWTALRQAYSRNPGVELPDITRERTGRHQAEQRAVKARLRSSTMQPQDRHNPVTRDAVATRATTSRRLNQARRAADPRPVSQRQEFSFEAEQATWDAYRGGRAPGQRARHADHAWRMDDGFRF